MIYRVIILCLLIPSLAWGQQVPIETIPPGEDKITSVKKGQLVPYDGQLFDIDTSIRWAFWLQQYKYRLAADVEKEQKFCETRVGHEKSVLLVEKDRNKKVEEDLRARLGKSEQARIQAEEDARNPPWYTTAEFGIVVGAVAAAAVFAVTAWALGESK